MRTVRRGPTSALLSLLLSACAHTPSAPAPRAACEALTGRSVEGARVTRATLVPAERELREYCQVLGTLPPALDFELRLPSAWNGRTVYGGGGGFDGVIFPGEEFTEQGYASVASNGGHNGDTLDAAFALEPEKRDDFASLSVHRVLSVVQALIRERYGRASERTWFEGCSNGGREALIEAQRWPEDFDGIIARAPAYNFVELMLAFNRHTQLLSQPGASLSDAKLASLGQAVLAACDAQDGLADGILSNPGACAFDPATLQCQGAESDACLTAAQLTPVRAVYAPYVLNGQTIYDGWPAGGENDPDAWATWITGHGTPSASVGGIFALFAPVLGWIGTAVTGSDTSANALFANLQVAAAERISVNPDLMLAANTAGGVVGKMISPQSLAIAATAVKMEGKESVILKNVVGYSVVFLAVVCIIVFLMTNALGFLVP